MSEDDTPAARVISQLASELAETIAKRYRIAVATARALVLEEWANDRALWQQAAQEADPARLARTRAYKQAADRAKTKIYYHLRRYRQDDAGLHDATERLRELAAAGVSADDPRALAIRETVVASHVSTRERQDDLDAFWAALFALVPDPTSILDLGCGVMPLLYAFERPGHATTEYLALDRDAVAVGLVEAWGALVGSSRLRARRWSLEDGFADVTGPEDGRFALALALKLVPVVARQEREHLAILRDVPARRLLVTGAKQAMVKRRSIDRREERVLRSFADDHGFSVIGTLDTPSELGLLLERA
jgi:hypothetical protein